MVTIIGVFLFLEYLNNKNQHIKNILYIYIFIVFIIYSLVSDFFPKALTFTCNKLSHII